ncbi:Uncharacterised protein g10896 [Pycnogonum litorale]
MLKIGGLIDPENRYLKQVFTDTVNKINNSSATKLDVNIKFIESNDARHVSREVCRLLKDGVDVVIGPAQTTGLAYPLIRSILRQYNVPHIDSSWHLEERVTSNRLNLLPPIEHFSKAIGELIKALEWKSFAVLYEDDDGLFRLKDILEQSFYKDDTSIMMVRRLGDNHGRIFSAMKRNVITKIVLDCRRENIVKILQEAHEAGMLEYHNFVITNINLNTVSIPRIFFSARTNITGLRLVDENERSDKLKVKHREWESNPNIPSDLIDVESASVIDSLHLLAKVKVDNLTTVPLSCDEEVKFENGHEIIDRARNVSLEGLTGNLQFRNGIRNDLRMDIIELGASGYEKVGEWTSDFGVNFTDEDNDTLEKYIDSLKNRKMKIFTILKEPFAMLKKNHHVLSGNDRFEGYCIDLVRLLAERLHFEYEINLTEDNSYGYRDPETGEWRGMIGDLLNWRADLVIGDLTITYQRQQVVDFTMPFMNLGIGILFKKPSETEPGLLSFLSPLSWEVWLYMLAAYCVVSVMMYLLARLTPYEWNPPEACCSRQKGDVLENKFTFANSFWFAIASLMQQGGDILPKAISTRVLAGSWWLFTLILISSYTANLTAFLTSQKMKSPIENAEDLSRQTKIKYGCYKEGSTEAFFKNSKLSTFQRMWIFMESSPNNVFATSNEQGIRRVMAGDYAYFMESTSIEYATRMNCDLAQVGGLLDSKGYGIALPPGSPYRSLISHQILKLQEQTLLDYLKHRWWVEKNSGKNCTNDQEDSDYQTENELSVANVSGIFVVLIAALGLAAVLSLLEFVIIYRRQAKANKADVNTKLKRELRYSLSRQNTKSNVFDKPKPKNKLLSVKYSNLLKKENSFQFS